MLSIGLSYYVSLLMVSVHQQFSLPHSLHVSLINLIHAYVICSSVVRPSLHYLDGLLIYLNLSVVRSEVAQLAWPCAGVHTFERMAPYI